MDRGAWQATVDGITRVRHHLATKEQQQQTHAYNEEVTGGFLTGFVKKLCDSLATKPHYKAWFSEVNSKFVCEMKLFATL